jgi:hypothetical protein
MTSLEEAEALYREIGKLRLKRKSATDKSLNRSLYKKISRKTIQWEKMVAQLRSATPPPGTAREVDAAATDAGGYTKTQLAVWGIDWPPPRNWKEALLGSVASKRRRSSQDDDLEGRVRSNGWIDTS